MAILRVFFLFSLFSFAFAHDTLNTNLRTRPLNLENPENVQTRSSEIDEELTLQCTSWRFAVESNNVSPWRKIPLNCVDYVKDYVTGRGYALDLERVSKEAMDFASSVKLNGDGKDVWVFDIDETLISNLPYYVEHNYGLDEFDHGEFDKWVEKGVGPVIEPSLKLYEKVMDLGFKVVLLTGRKESHRLVTVNNLINAGFKNWDRLILRTADTQEKPATIYKSEKRAEMVADGYRIYGNSGDQWSDLLGSSVSIRSFKLPNPMYYIP